MIFMKNKVLLFTEINYSKDRRAGLPLSGVQKS